MTFNPLKPDPGPSPALDASIIRTNFSQFASIFSNLVFGVNYNHMPLNNVNQGKHASVLFEKQSSDPGATQGYATLYAKDVANATPSTQPNLFIQIPKFLPNEFDTRNAANDPMQLTYPTVNIVGPNQYQSFLAGGYVLYFGKFTQATPLPTTITVSPTPTKILIAIAEAQNADTGGNPLPVSTNITSATQFTVYSQTTSLPANYTFSWMALAQQ